MLNFLLDIAPDKSQLLLTIKLAGILREKKQEVYYTYTSNPAFTPVLYDKGIRGQRIFLVGKLSFKRIA